MARPIHFEIQCDDLERAKKFYADRNARVVSRRVSDARSRLAELERTQVRKPPAPLSFAGVTLNFLDQYATS